jgi:hypothetical protein
MDCLLIFMPQPVDLPKLKNRCFGPDMVAQAYNPCYSGDRDWEIVVHGKLGQKLLETPISING